MRAITSECSLQVGDSHANVFINSRDSTENFGSGNEIPKSKFIVISFVIIAYFSELQYQLAVLSSELIKAARRAF